MAVGRVCLVLSRFDATPKLLLRFSAKPATSGFYINIMVLNELKDKPQALGLPYTSF